MTDSLYRIDFTKQAELILIEQYECDVQQLIDAKILVPVPADDLGRFIDDVAQAIHVELERIRDDRH